MDEYLSEKEQLERIKDWWRQNGWYLVGGAVLGAFLLFGWNQYGAYQERRAEAAAAIYQSLLQAVENNRESEAVALLEQLRSEYDSSPYTDHGGLLIARVRLVSDTEAAAAALRNVMENSSDEELAMIARLRLARVLAYQERHQEALGLLTVPEPGHFSARINEIKGDIHVALNEPEAARVAYLQALAAPATELLDRNFVQMKLDDLPGGGDDAASAGAEVSEEGGS